MKELDDAWQRASTYASLIRERHVAPAPATVARLVDFDEPFPVEPLPADAVLELLDRSGSPATMATTGGRYFGFVIGGVLPAALAADWLTAAWGQNAGLDVASPVAAKLDDLAIRWTAEALGLPATGGALVTGATMANLTGLLAARETLLRRHGWDVSAKGLFGAPPITVVLGGEVHVSLRKSLAILGLGKDRVLRVAVDEQGRMLPDSLPLLDGPAIVCLQAGNVNSGAFDPAAELIPLAKESGAWVHVDGAFGLWAAAAPARRYLMSGFELADSWATDAHKWLNAGYDCGIALLRDAAPLRDALDSPAAYLFHGENRQPSHYTPESSRRARGVPVWAALKSLGRSGLADLVERCCRHAARFAEGLRDAGFEVLNDVVLNQVVVAFGDASETRRVITAIQNDGTCWCGATEWKGRVAMRISVSSWATTADDVEESLEAIVRVGQASRPVRGREG
jgi:glutamate/tyrosine decarboxylase-like PLP-dependent enzyme